MVFNANMNVQAKLPFSIKKLSNIYVYSDIVELLLVGNSQVTIIKVFLNKFQKIGHWLLNLSMYVRVKDKNIRTITINIFTETGKEFPIHDDVVTCRLNFRRRPVLD